MFTRGAHQVVWWICKNDKTHEWPASINSRTNLHGGNRGRGCPLCNSKISMLELRIFSEFKSIFNEVEQRKRINRIECDIYLPEIKVAVEVDGSFWHKNKVNSDKIKNLKLAKLGIKVIRVRGTGLSKISRLDLVHKFSKNPLNLIKALLHSILKIRKVDKITNNTVKKYFRTKSFHNDNLFKNLLNMLPWALPGNRLSDKRPDIAEEWHPTKNGTLTPDKVSVGSAQMVFWLCKMSPNHIWRAKVIDRTYKNSKCRFCSGREASLEYNLSVTDPEIAKQWHPLKNRPWTPQMVTRGSHKVFYWVCNKYKTHEWQSTVNKRTSDRGCPYCTNKIPCKENCLATIYPDIAKEWHPTKNKPYTSRDVTFGSGMDVWWQCSIYKSHNWKVSINDRTAYKTGCYKCMRKKANKHNCLATVNPKLAREWHPTKNGKLTPKDITTQAIKRVFWICHNDITHDWKATVNQRKWNDKCPICKERN